MASYDVASTIHQSLPPAVGTSCALVTRGPAYDSTIPVVVSPMSDLTGGPLRTSTRTEIGTRPTSSVNVQTDARRRMRRINVGGVLVLNTPPA
jgi:hypothetical protein